MKDISLKTVFSGSFLINQFQSSYFVVDVYQKSISLHTFHDNPVSIYIHAYSKTLDLSELYLHLWQMKQNWFEKFHP